MKCERATDLIAASVVNALDDQEREALHEHLSVCQTCTKEISEVEALWRDIARAGVPTPEPNGLQRLRATLEQHESGYGNPINQPSTLPYRRWAAGVAAALALIAFGVMSGIRYERARAVPSAAVVNPQPRFLVLMRGVDSATESDSTIRGAVGVWAGQLQTQQQLLDGGAIQETPGSWLGPVPPAFELQGMYELDSYMIIQAPDMQTARNTALQAPHLVQGGSVEIWPIR